MTYLAMAKNIAFITTIALQEICQEPCSHLSIHS